MTKFEKPTPYFKTDLNTNSSCSLGYIEIICPPPPPLPPFGIIRSID